MKKVKTLYWFIIILIVIYIVNYLGNLYLTFYPPNFIDDHYNQFIFGYYTQFIGLAFSIITFIALFYVQKGLSITINKGFFNDKSSRKFKGAGKLFLISGVLSLVWNLTLLIYSNGKFPFAVINQDILLMLIGFGLLIITDYITNGNTLQQENDLTI